MRGNPIFYRIGGAIMANSNNPLVARKSEEYTQEEMIELFGINILLPEDNDNYFKNIIGHTDIIKNFTQIVKILSGNESIEILGHNYHPSFLLMGEQGIGKALLTYSFAKEMNLPIVAFDTEKLLQDYSTKTMKGIKKLISQFPVCVVLFKEIDYGCQLEKDKATTFFSRICSLMKNFPDSYFFASISSAALFPPFLLSDEGFDTTISFNVPDPKERELLINKFLTDIPHDPSLDIEKLAREFIGHTAGQIYDMLKKSYVQCFLQGQNFLTYEIINSTMYSEWFGKKIRKMSEMEMRLTAYHEAGHVIAGYYGCPNYKVSKVEVVYRENSLGLTDHEADEEKLSTTREDIKGAIITNLGGKVGEQIMFNTSTSGVMQDLANAVTLAEAFVKRFGMDDTFGPIYIEDDIYYSDTLSAIADVKIQELLINLENKTTQIILEHKDKLIAIAEELIKKETLYKDEILAILENNDKKVTKKSSTKKHR